MEKRQAKLAWEIGFRFQGGTSKTIFRLLHSLFPGIDIVKTGCAIPRAEKTSIWFSTGCRCHDRQVPAECRQVIRYSRVTDIDAVNLLIDKKSLLENPSKDCWAFLPEVRMPTCIVPIQVFLIQTSTPSQSSAAHFIQFTATSLRSNFLAISAGLKERR